MCVVTDKWLVKWSIKFKNDKIFTYSISLKILGSKKMVSSNIHLSKQK